MPGSLESSAIRRLIGPAYTSLSPLHPGQAGNSPAAEPGNPAEPARGELLGGAERLVDGGGDHVLKELGLLGIDRLRGDGDLAELQVAGHRHLDGAAARARL